MAGSGGWHGASLRVWGESGERMTFDAWFNTVFPAPFAPSSVRYRSRCCYCLLMYARKQRISVASAHSRTEMGPSSEHRFRQNTWGMATALRRGRAVPRVIIGRARLAPGSPPGHIGPRTRAQVQQLLCGPSWPHVMLCYSCWCAQCFFRSGNTQGTLTRRALRSLCPVFRASNRDVYPFLV